MWLMSNVQTTCTGRPTLLPQQSSANKLAQHFKCHIKLTNLYVAVVRCNSKTKVATFLLTFCQNWTTKIRIPTPFSKHVLWCCNGFLQFSTFKHHFYILNNLLMSSTITCQHFRNIQVTHSQPHHQKYINVGSVNCSFLSSVHLKSTCH